MARFNELLVGRVNRALQKWSGIKGTVPTPQLGTEVMPVVSMPWGVEMRYPESWIMHSWEVVIAALAANLNAAMLRNPASSGVIAVIIKVQYVNNGGANDNCIMSLGPRTTDLPTPITIASPSCFDRRAGTQTSAMIASIQQAAGPQTAPPDRLFITIPPGTYDLINDGVQEFPLLPGDAVAFRNGVVNQGSVWSLWWRERAIEDSEKF